MANIVTRMQFSEVFDQLHNLVAGKVFFVSLLILLVNIATDVVCQLTMDPPGAFLVFDNSSSRNSEPVVLKCNSSGNASIIWDLPVLNFGELINQNDFNALSEQNKQNYDLLNGRVKIVTSKNENGEGFTSTLTIQNMITWHEGYYTCRSTIFNETISSRLYIFPILGDIRVSTHGFFAQNRGVRRIRDIDPLRSYYVVQDPLLSSPVKKSTIIVPCLLSGQKDGSTQSGELILQRKIHDRNAWDQITKQDKIQKLNYSLVPGGTGNAIFKAYELSFTEQDSGMFGVYRCIISRPNSSGHRIVSEPFSILVEAKKKNNNDKPVIRPSVKYLVFQPGSTFNLTCQMNSSRSGGKIITWKSPESLNPQGVKTSISRTTWEVAENGFTVVTLTVSEATYADTGFYTCHSTENERLFQEQYVFIQDLNTLMTFTFRPYRVNAEPWLFGFVSQPFYTASRVEPFINVILVAVHSFPILVRIIPTSPLVDMIVYRITPLGGRLQIYPRPTEGSNVNRYGNWSFDMFEGFKTSNSSWDMAGDYQVEALYLKEFTLDSRSALADVERKTFPLQFSIYIEGMEIIPSETQAIRGKPFSLKCRWKFPRHVHPMLDRNKIFWFWSPKSQSNSPIIEFTYETFSQKLGAREAEWDRTSVNSNGFYESVLSLENVTTEASGRFLCILRYDRKDGQYGNEGIFSATYEMNVLVVSAPIITGFHPISGILDDVSLGQENTLSCQVDAFPPASDIHWLDSRGSRVRDGVIVHPNGSSTTLTFAVTSNFNDTGNVFTCQFTNSEGTTNKTFTINLVNESLIGIYAAVGIGALVFVVLLGLLLRNIYLIKKRDKRVRLTRERLLGSGDPGRINPDISLDEQIDLLPYDPKWEFPQDRLIFGKQLGAGQFGVVVQAKQIGSVQNPKSNQVRTVAVKMIKSSLNPTSLESLISELKILIHLGPHLNVVNLLGACTKEILNGELLVIEEFCLFGNLHDYLIANKDSFVNELHETSTMELQYGVNLAQKKNNKQQTQKGRYLDMSQPNTSTINEPQIPSLKMNVVSKDSVLFINANQDKDQTVVLNSEGYLAPSTEEASATPMNGGIITTRDLISWSFQIASGMNHLANKKVIHGDLAARNVLLTDGNVVKIADFGLSRQTKYNEGTYMKQGKEALPVKWMAIESLMSRIYTTQSDVWSFGVVIWELFSFGLMPYPEVATLKDLISLLRNGERLEKPSCMSSPLGALMVECWKEDPKERPTFTRLEREIGNLLGDDVKNYYLEMNGLYMEIN